MKLIPQYLNAFRKRVYYRWGKCLKAMCSQSYGFSSSQVYMEELDHKEGWVLKNWCFWIVVLEKTLEHGWHHQLNGHESEQALGDSEGQGSLECCSPWGCKKLDMTERLNNNKNVFQTFRLITILFCLIMYLRLAFSPHDIRFILVLPCLLIRFK